MGEVWRARHTALKRDDALKVLPDAFATDGDRLARFQREAQVLASLNHQNIAHVCKGRHEPRLCCTRCSGNRTRRCHPTGGAPGRGAVESIH
jgi:serine/threonine protein kinase